MGGRREEEDRFAGSLGFCPGLFESCPPSDFRRGFSGGGGQRNAKGEENPTEMVFHGVWNCVDRKELRGMEVGFVKIWQI